MKGITLSALVVLAGVAMLGSGGCAWADGWMARADFSDCPRQYIPQTSGEEGPFATEAECEARIENVENTSQLGCAHYECDEVGGGSGGASVPSAGGGNLQQQLLMEGTMVGGYMIGRGIRESIEKNEQQQKAEAATARAQAKRQAQIRARRNAAASRRLLGEGGSDGGGSDLSLMGVTAEPQLQLMTGAQALQPVASNQAAATGKHSDAFHKGLTDASQCYSQNAGPYCYGRSGAAWQSCLSDYRAGYQVGVNVRKMKLKEATQVGYTDGSSGRAGRRLQRSPGERRLPGRMGRGLQERISQRAICQQQCSGKMIPGAMVVHRGQPQRTGPRGRPLPSLEGG